MMMMTQAAGEKRPSFDCFLIPGAAGGSRSSSAAISGASDHNKRLKTGGGSGAGISGSSTKASEFGGRKVEKKDKIGEKIAALQQLVSPFGKTDTASVLQEATGYIRFLHDQIQVLSAPYLQTPIMENTQEAERCILRSRGLCLMPLSSTLNIARSNGADIWAPRNTSKRQ